MLLLKICEKLIDIEKKVNGKPTVGFKFDTEKFFLSFEWNHPSFKFEYVFPITDLLRMGEEDESSLLQYVVALTNENYKNAVKELEAIKENEREVGRSLLRGY